MPRFLRELLSILLFGVLAEVFLLGLIFLLFIKSISGQEKKLDGLPSGSASPGVVGERLKRSEIRTKTAVCVARNQNENALKAAESLPRALLHLPTFKYSVQRSTTSDAPRGRHPRDSAGPSVVCGNSPDRKFCV